MNGKTVTSTVSEHRLRTDIEQIGEFGAVDGDGHGRHALPGTAANGAAREYLIKRLEDAGLDVRIDAVGNIAGRWVPEGADDEQPVAAGSHLDSVPDGGIFDGVLGVFGGLEAVRSLQESNVSLSHPVEVVCFTEEEGVRFSDGLLGSSVATGKRTVDDALALEDDDGTTLGEALTEIGFQGDGRIDASEWSSWLELHPEQDTKLLEADAQVGIVTEIAGTIRSHVEIDGKADHAGTTAMDERNDALAAASELVLDVERTAQDIANGQNGAVVGTVGRVDVVPNAVNVVPDSVSLRLDIRSTEYEALLTQVSAVESSLDRLETERGVRTTIDRPYDYPPTPMTETCQTVISEAAIAHDVDTIELHSMAGHDTMNVADVTAAGLIFAPSKGGYSHSPKEWTDWQDCTASTQVLTEAVAQLAK